MIFLNILTICQIMLVFLCFSVSIITQFNISALLGRRTVNARIAGTFCNVGTSDMSLGEREWWFSF